MTHRRRRQHLPQEQGREPAASLPDHLKIAHVKVRSVEGFHAADLLDVLGGFLLGDIQHVVSRNDAEHMAVLVGYWQSYAVIFLEGPEEFLPVDRGRNGNQGTV